MYSTFKSDIESGGRSGEAISHPVLTLDAPDAAWDVVPVEDAEKSENPF